MSAVVWNGWKHTAAGLLKRVEGLRVERFRDLGGVGFRNRGV